MSGVNLTGLTESQVTSLTTDLAAKLTASSSLDATKLTGALPAISGASLTNLTAGNLTGTLPAISGANLTSLTAGNLTGTLPAISGANLTGVIATTATKWATARTLAGNSVDGSANVTFANKFIVQGTTDSGLSGPQFLGALGTGLVKNTTTTGVLSIAAAGTDYLTPTGIGSGLTSLTAGNLTGTLPAISGANLTSLTAGNLTGTLPAISGVNLTSLTAGNLTGTLPAISGVNLTSLNASNLSSGTVPNARIGNNNVRTICYVAGSESSGAPTLATTDGEKSFFYNLTGAMTALTGKPGLTCQTNAGTATIQINKNGGVAGTLSPTLACTTGFGANTPASWPVSAIAANDALDFSITAVSGATRITVCIGATVN